MTGDSLFSFTVGSDVKWDFGVSTLPGNCPIFVGVDCNCMHFTRDNLYSVNQVCNDMGSPIMWPVKLCLS